MVRRPDLRHRSARGVATSPDGFTWTKHPGNPILLTRERSMCNGWVETMCAGGGSHQHPRVQVLRPIELDPGWLSLKKRGGLRSFGPLTPHLVMKQGDPIAVFGGASDPC